MRAGYFDLKGNDFESVMHISALLDGPSPRVIFGTALPGTFMKEKTVLDFKRTVVT
jgi:hypothetical protein